MRWVVVLVVACRFEPGELTRDDAAAPVDDAPMIDARPIDARPIDARVCPAPAPGCSAAFTCGTTSSCYYACGNGTSKATWSGAKGSCEGTSINGCIVTVNDQAEQDCITLHTNPTFSTFVWIGYRQSNNTQEPAGNWAWECPASSYVQPGWGTTSDEPNDTGGNEDCTALTNGGAWFDANCSGTARYVCEVP